MYSREDVLRANKLGVKPSTRAARLSRRAFIKVSATASGGLLVAMYWNAPAATRTTRSPVDTATAFQPSAFIRIDADDQVTIWCREADMGEGVKTSLTMIIADELDADWSRLRVENGELDRQKFGPQGVGGSDAMVSAWDDHRRAGAVARHMLVDVAAAEWGVPASECRTANGVVTHAASGRRTGYGTLAARAATLPIPTQPTLKPRDAYRLIGTRVAGVDNHKIVNGQRLFGLDVTVPGLKYAAVAKSPVFAAAPAAIDSSKALLVKGVQRIVEIKGLDNPTFLQPGVAVVADSTWAAFKGREALVVQWADSEFANDSNQSISSQFAALLARPDATLHESGDVERALAAAAYTVDNRYEFPFVSHATLEPHNCTAEVRDGECWITGPLQMPAQGRVVVAQALGIGPEKVHVQCTRIGGGFGRRLLCDYAAEAAVVSKAIGAPVKVVDTRTGDLQHDYYRPAAAQRIRAGADASGRIIAWDHVVASVSRSAYRKDPRPPFSTEMYGCYVGAVKQASELEPDLAPTRIAHARLRYGSPRTGVPTGAWRAPAHVVNAFAIETTIDDLAARARRSPVDIRIELLGKSADVPENRDTQTPYDPARMRRVLVAAAERGGYGARAPEGRARGIASHFTFGSYCAQVVELSVDGKKRVAIHKVTAVIDVGQPINLSGLEAQAEGAIIDGLGAAFFAEVPIDRGRALARNFDDYRLIRNREAPAVIEVFILPSTIRPTGFGEPPIPPIAPAVANAIAALTGERLRRMPFTKSGFDLAPHR